MVFGSGLLVVRRAKSGIFKNQGIAVTERDFGCLPCWAYSFAKASEHRLVKPVGIGMDFGNG
jgi:hypothetical protein